MKIAVTDVSPIRKSMAVEAGADEIARERESLLRSYARRLKVPGFRPGKAPLSLIRARYGREVEEDLKERLVARLYDEAIREKGLHPLGDPVVEKVTFEEGAPFRFETSFEVAPDFTPKRYHGVEVRRPAVSVTDEEVERALEGLRQASARFVVDEGRAAASGDVVVADVEGQPEGGEAFRREGAVLEVGAPGAPPEFDANLEGATAGASLEFEVRYPQRGPGAEAAARTVRYRIKVHEVKRREVAPLDDEFARDVGDFDSLEALRASIREERLARKRAEADRALRQAVLDKVLLENPIPLPDALVRDEVRRRLEDVARAMIDQGLDPRAAEVDWKGLRERLEDPARKTVHARLVLEAVGRAEGLAVAPNEIDERLRVEAERIGETREKLRASLKKGLGLEPLTTQMVREKSLDFLVSVANIQTEE